MSLKETLNWRHLGRDVQIYEPSVFLNPHMISIGDFSRLDSFIKCEGGLGLHISSGCHISSFVHILGGGTLFIGNNVAITTGACIITGSNTMAGQAMSSAAPKEMQVVERSFVEIGDFAMVAAHAVVLPGVRIGRYAIAGAGAVVTHDIPDYKIAFGCPARVVGDRREKEGWDYK